MAGPTIAEATAEVVFAGSSSARTSTRCPRSARQTAVVNPITPAPITTTSGAASGAISSSSHAVAAKPEGHDDTVIGMDRAGG